MLIDTEVPVNKEFFRVKKIVDNLKESPDYNKDRLILLLDMAEKLYREIEIGTNDKKIKAYKFSGTKVVSAELSEGEILVETTKAIEEHFNTDVAIENLTFLIKFWKNASREKDAYKPLLGELINLANETRVYLQETKEIAALKESIRNKEMIISNLKSQNDEIFQKYKDNKFKKDYWREPLRAVLTNFNVIKEHYQLRKTLNPELDKDIGILTDIVLYLCFEGEERRAYIEKISEDLNIKKGKVTEIVEKFNNVLEFNPKGDAVGIIHRRTHRFDIEDFLGELGVENNGEPIMPTQTPKLQELLKVEGKNIFNDIIDEESDAENEEKQLPILPPENPGEIIFKDKLKVDKNTNNKKVDKKVERRLG